VEQNSFNDFIEDAEYEFDRINNGLKKKSLPPRELLVEIYQSIHAIKSNSLILGLYTFGEKLHTLETTIKELRQKENISFQDMLHITVELEKRMSDKDKFLELLRHIQKFNSASGETIKKDEQVFIETLAKACERAAEELNKKARFTVEDFDTETLLHGQRRLMKEILTQLIRNAVSHGIESPEDRKHTGKDETGVLRLSVKTEGDRIRIVLKDDGQGLDFDRIAQKAEAQGLIKNGEDKNNRRFLSTIIFMPGFSTAEVENKQAGRGIGLNLVRDRLMEAHGTISLRSARGKGTAFDIRIPLVSAH
jgi:two-component system chemotaxis sensor kinase CheA